MSFNYNFPIKLNISQTLFKPTSLKIKPNLRSQKDSFVSNPIYDSLSTKEQIEQVSRANPQIMNLLKRYDIPLQINIKELENLKQGHMKDTRIITSKIYSALPDDLKNNIDLSSLQDAALLHDYGKVLIPLSVLNKTGKLTPKEQEIMELHSILGYELLKNKNLDRKTLALIKYHHQNLAGTGYPEKMNDYEYDIATEILSVADKYSALREKRSYKSPLAKYEALEIIAKDVNTGRLSQEIYTALLKSL